MAAARSQSSIEQSSHTAVRERVTPTDADFGEDTDDELLEDTSDASGISAARSAIDLGSSLTAMDWLPRVHVGTGDGRQPDGKPPHSYAELIAFAIKSVKVEPKRMTLAEIYKYIVDKFPYYRTAGTGWKNSIRHNLSLNRMFLKISREKDDPGKGSYWAVDETVAAEAENGVVKTTKRKKKRPSSTSAAPYSAEHRTSVSENVGNRNGPRSASSPGGANGRSRSRSNSSSSRILSSTHSASFPAGVALAANHAHAPTFKDLNSSFQDLYQSVLESSSTQGVPNPGIVQQPPVMSLDAMEQVMQTVTANKQMQSNVDQTLFRQTQQLIEQCRTEVQHTNDLLESSKFPNLAQSFSNIFQQIGGPSSSASANIMYQAATAMKAVDAEEEAEDEFNWDSLL